MNNNGKIAYVGMSGGVDSSVSAALLKSQGFKVSGVFIKVWQPDFMPCSWKDERRDAMRVAAHLDIPFVTLDLEKEYKKEVVDYMIDEYKRGRTPNPDIMCNRHVKFGGFFDYAIKNGADFVATGHYARCMDGNLLVGKDKNKDQSYFLWTLTKKQLDRTIFPVGDMEKSDVRKLAKKFKLPNAEKKDSQGLCFIGKIDMKEFLQHYMQPEMGDVLNENGTVIGRHQGALFYTLGERHGFEIFKKTSNERPYFVIGKNIERNTLIVSNNASGGHSAENGSFIKIKDVNWINEQPSLGKTYQAQVRYRGKFQEIKVASCKRNSATLIFLDEPDSPASGQSVVVYDGEKCIGGGIIDVIQSTREKFF
jgi:tRNA-uridine 2-sulfurtransferase